MRIQTRKDIPQVCADSAHSQSMGFTVLVVLVVLGVVAVGAYALSGPSKGSGQNVRWWNPTTWGTHKPADQVDKAQVQVQSAQVKVDDSKAVALHAAHVEIHKASIAEVSLAPSTATDLTRRFTGNGLSLLDQFDPLTASETQADVKELQDLLSTESARRIAAESAQQDDEKKLGLLSTQLTSAQDSLKQKDGLLETAEKTLRTHFDTENALANEERNSSFLWKLALGCVVLLSLLGLYLHYCLGSVGAGLQGLQKILPTDTYQTVVSNLDGAVDKLGQSIVAAGKKKAAALETDAAHVLGLTPQPQPAVVKTTP